MSNYVVGKYFFGNEISEYGQKNNRVDYATLAKSFDAVISNDLMEKTADIGYWELENGDLTYYYHQGKRYTEEEFEEKKNELQEYIDNIEEDNENKIEELIEKIKKCTDHEDGILDVLDDELYALQCTDYEDGILDDELYALQDRQTKLQKELNSLLKNNSIEGLKKQLEELEDLASSEDEVYQWYIISDNGASILKDWTNEIVYYNDELDLYLWGVTHYGTSWGYVLTDIKCNVN